MIIQLNPAIPVTTPKGAALAHALIDEGLEHDIKWICFLDINGECWTFKNQYIRAQKNITHGREFLSPFYDPDDVVFQDQDDEEEEPMDWEKCYSEKAEEADELREDLKDYKDDNSRLTKSNEQLKSLIKKLLQDDHVFPPSREKVKQIMNEIKDEDELPY